MAAIPHRGSLPFIHRRASVAARNDAHDSMFLPHGQSHNFINRLRARKQSNSQSTLTPAEAVWFLSLPDKVRRQHFTKEEQILIRAKSELVLLDTAPDVLNHVEETQPPMQQHMRSKSIAYDSRTRPELPSIATMPALPTLDGFRSSPNSPGLDSEDMETPRMQNDTFHGSPFKQHRSTFLRSPTVRHSCFVRSNTSGNTSPTMDVRPDFHRSKTSPSRAQPPPPLPILAQKTLYLKDPHTKEFLRDCLDSSKFEETLNFGFPSATSNLGFRATMWEAVSPGTDVRMNWLDSPADEDEEDDEFLELSSADEADLSTPTSVVHPSLLRRGSSKCSSDADQEEDDDFVARNHSGASYFEALMNRDMTLRMTLTRPELRASDEELYGWQDGYEEVAPVELEVTRDPLALESLNFSDDMSGLNGAFAQELAKKKGIKGLWARKYSTAS
ncbi:hypothetical protein K461DRAFT_279995 [Myriangium duriaei CBS 260.36]|uniref:Uncharacterized protein n=1 Tax=Myriangium duriaei CBS 260.36 TaxID=1168546 RepID=A0A9P4IYV7_9PEZI|nr:hypothetical protein K461DRAFT_279995 [Myriangium duriaei CBS 260.36]